MVQDLARLMEALSQLNEIQLKLVARFMEVLVETQEHQGGEFQIGRERGEINRC